MKLDDVDPVRGVMVVVTAHAMKPWNSLKEGTRFWLENHRVPGRPRRMVSPPGASCAWSGRRG
ncbi:MAG: hypothetical protein U1F77_14065 [Kiritimatiellia bacterium]